MTRRRAASPTAPARYPPTLKRYGQHFLTDMRVLDRIVEALALTGDETVVEIGAGRGVLTDRLAPRARRLVAIELDRALADLLRQRYAESPHVQVVQGDVLAQPLAALGGGSYVLAGNVPYYITTPILFHALESPAPDRAVFLVQREVAERVVAAPGSKTYGALSVNVQAVARAELLMHVPPGAFSPPPKVDSALLRITPRSDPVVRAESADRYRRFVIDAFGLRRKQMRRVVRTILSLDAERADKLLAGAGLDPEVRPETLTAEEFAAVVRGATGPAARD